MNVVVVVVVGGLIVSAALPISGDVNHVRSDSPRCGAPKEVSGGSQQPPLVPPPPLPPGLLHPGSVYLALAREGEEGWDSAVTEADGDC
ncbi:hypothetical protein Pmani_032203 [Petrolisthes manimaculis]|uniref:Secreted protein n=1 Tax=Petrolisthes manimaculis TaxID=1843537 RepID=A0AAE1NS62_9EUCA|nr:hypothetical protein Pmani_032203 [Petrolisthes manimaculis]